MAGFWPFGRTTIEVPCTVEIERTAESLHAHASPQGVDIRPGDTVILQGAPDHVPFGERTTIACRAIVIRAGLAERLWTHVAGMFELTELYEVGFSPKETP